MTETVQQQMARESQPSYVRVRGKPYRVVSSASRGGKIVKLGVDPGGSGSITWLDAATVDHEPEAVAKAAWEAKT